MNFFRQFMYGRYGFDPLSGFWVMVSVLLSLLSRLLGLALLRWAGNLILLIPLYRMMSRDIAKRQAENIRFLELARPWAQWGRQKSLQLRDREHKYFACPKCGQQLRVPRGKGTLSITCRSCGHVFQKRS